MLLIADGGSTKTAWSLVNPHTKAIQEFRTEGYNPYFIGTIGIIDSIQNQLLPQLETGLVSQIYFYGAGCSTPEKNDIVFQAIKACFPSANVYVGHDMLAAARALLQHEKGFAAILGTGANTCMYDGKDVSLNIDSLGYLMGDEGSGSYIGKKVVRDFMRGYLPVEIQKAFTEKYHLSNEDIFDNLYHKPLPNRFLASFCDFASEHYEHPHIQEIIRQSFFDFFNNLVSHYPDYKNYSFNCIGSVGYNFKNILMEVSEQQFGMKTAKILRSPIADLVKYHLESAG